MYPASYPLWTLQGRRAPEWMVNLLADIYAAEITGTHGMGICHPRATWLTLLISNSEECPCGELGRWEDGTERGEKGSVVWCARCAEAEIVLLEARWARIHALSREVDRRCVPRAVDEIETTPIPHRETMAALVFGGQS